MKALVLVGPRNVEVRDVPVPKPEAGQILVRHHATAISTGSEVIRYLNGQGPNIGYLGAGVVEQVGEGVTRFRVGDRVRTAGPHHEYGLIDEEETVAVPDGVDFETAAYAYLPTLVLHGLRLCEYELGENVSVIGQGVVGLLGSAMAEACGISVIALDVDERRLELAGRLGIRYPLNPSTREFPEKLREIVGDRGVDVSIDATGSYQGLIQAMEMTRKSGRIGIVGMYRPDPPDAETTRRLHEAYLKNLHAKELRLVGCSNDPPEQYPSHLWRFSRLDNIRLSLELLAREAYEIQPVITHRFQPEDGPELYRQLSGTDHGMLGVVFKWGKS